MLTHEKAVSFLKQNPALSLSVLEKEAQLPVSTLSKALTGDRQLNSKHLSSLYPVFVKYGFKEFTGPQAKILAVVNHKGGVGKTTTTVNLGKALVTLGYRVLLIDLDPQGNLSQALGHDSPEKQVVQALVKEQPLPICQIAENFDLAPSDLELAYADLELVQEVGGVNQLKNAIAPIRDQYNYILIDCPPALNIFTNSALVAANGCLITLQPEASALKGVKGLFDRIMQIRDRINYKLTIEGIVLTMVDTRLKVHRDMIDHIKESLSNITIFTAVIRMNVALKESQIAQQSIFEYAPDSNGAHDYHKLAQEICGHVS